MEVIGWTMKKEQGKMENAHINSDDIMFEILKRIPGKSLTRFRCVSKHWNHLIRRPDFVTTHYNYSKIRAAAAPTVLFSVSHHLKQIFYTINGEGEAQHYLTIDTSKFGFKTHCAPQFINGIFCLFDHYTVLVCNIATGEIVELPVSSLAGNYSYRPRYSLGFDPVNNEYKVLCVWTNYQASSTAESQVFTVGISKEWRNIDTLPRNIYYPRSRSTRSVCVNGAIHWATELEDFGNKTVVVSFDVRNEKFRIIELPSDYSWGRLGPPVQVLQFEGNVAIVNRNESELLILEDDSDEIWTVDFEENFQFPENPNDLVITSDSERFFIFKRNKFGRLELFHYDTDGILLRSTKITGLEEAGSRWVWQSTLNAAINEHLENMYLLARN